MQKKKLDRMKIIQGILKLFVVFTFVFFILGEIFMPPENKVVEGEFRVFEADWERIMPDGTRGKLNVPGDNRTAGGEWLIAETVLPSQLNNTCLCIRSLQQDFKIYIDGELRKEYSTIDTQLWGKTSTISYVIFDVYKEDAGKTLRIESMSDSSYSGYMSEIYIGERSQIWKHFMSTYGLGAIIAAFLVILGGVVTIASAITGYVYKKKSELMYLGNTVLLVAFWIIVESKLRQFIMPNSTIAMYVGFFIVMLIPYPCIAYINAVQKYRYTKEYYNMLLMTVANFVYSTSMQLLGLKDFFETMTISHIILIMTIILIYVTMFLDIKRNFVKEYKEVAIGLAGVMAAGIIEVLLTYLGDTAYNSVTLCIGLVFLFIMAGIKAGKDIFKTEKEKQIAIAASESKAMFLANMSHEIRTPINTVIGMNEMILRENEDATIEEYAVNIKNASHMLLSLINDVLDFSKIEAGKLQIVESEYDTAAMIKDVIVSTKVRMGDKKLTFTSVIDKELPSVIKGDEIRIKQVLNNLLSNAIKYTDSGTITLDIGRECSDDKFCLKIQVKDTGKGIKPEDMDNLFTMFRRFELKTNRYIEGTGLGLTITKQLVENMGGIISVDSEYGKGSCFTVTIPQEVILDSPIGEFDKTERADRVKSEEKGFYVNPNARILVVDDNKINIAVIVGLLKRSQVMVDTAPGGMECFELTKENKYDLILMDHMMPQPDGIATLHMIREDKDNLNANTKIIVLTANAIAGVEKTYIKEGFDGYLSKPVEVDRLEETLEKYLK